MRGFSSMFLTVTGLIYVMLVVNIATALTCAPFWILLLLVDLRHSWLWMALTAILLAPALAGTYAVFKSYSLEGSTSAIRTYFRAWWHSWRRLWPVALGFQGFFILVGLDFYAMVLWGWGMAVLPLAIVLVALGLVTALLSWTGLMDRPDLTRRAVVKASLYLGVRKAGWSLISLVVLAAVAAIIWTKPAIGLGLLIGPALYVVWGNSRRSLASILPPDEQVQDDAMPTAFHRSRA